MKNITLAIPFYNTSQYFSDCIKYAVDDDFVSEIVVNDDCSDRAIRLLTTDPISLRDIPAFCKRTGHHLASINEGPLLEFIIELKDN